MGQFILFKTFNNDKIIESVLKLREEYIESKFDDILANLLEKAMILPIDGNLYKMYLCHLISRDENLLTLSAENIGRDIDKKIYEIALRDIENIIELFNINIEFCTMDDKMISKENKIFNILDNSKNANEVLDLLIDFFFENGAGIMNSYNAFKWDKDKGLLGIENCDPISFNELIGYNRQKDILMKNTESFINGELSNNILLFGDSGTGKSSSVKALLNKYSCNKLRLLELNKKDFMDLNRILSCIKKRGLKFILFLDDLSFEEFECEYKNMKALIEGGVEVKPRNVLIYATSNRRNLIRESFDDRQGGEIHAKETVEEKHSLAERFGITLTYLVGNQKEYLDTVYKLAQIYNIDMPNEKLREEAIKWAALSSGKSNRIAKQFIMSINSLL